MMVWMRTLVTILFVASLAAFAATPTISADLGPCTADFKVTNNDGKPIYDAKVHVLIRYGFMAKRKTDLEAATDANGELRFTGMPSDAKRDIVFTVKKDTLTQTVPYDPTTNCHPHFDVKLTP